MNELANGDKAFDRQDHLQVVDALRGYAILLVIAVHSLEYTRELVWPAKRLLILGFYGVQLFFLASAMTLLMSWARSADPLGKRIGKFFVRRFFRIAPLYYLAVVLYWFAYATKPEQFSFDLLISTLLFYNAWSPYLNPTIPAWTPVPGGWSISVEFCFYFAFPIFAIAVTNLRRALVFVAIAVGVMIGAAVGGMQLYPEITAEQRANFLYFWPPNQLVIFALGFLLYYCVKHPAVRAWVTASRITANGASIVLGLGLLALSFYGPRKFFDLSAGLPPTHFVISLMFLAWAIVLVIKPGGVFINSMIVGLGQVSFSAYVLHFAVLRFLGFVFEKTWPFATVGLASVAYALTLLGCGIVITRYVAGATYRYVEQPFIRLGKTLLRRR